jgi:hypothetical protein
MEFFSALFDFERYMPHGYCFLWMPHILWMHIIGDIVIITAYYSIPATILYLLHKRKKTLPFKWVFLMFALFIFLCGTTHLVSLITLWYPIYYLEGVLKIITGIASFGTAVLMFPLIPRLIEIFGALPNNPPHKKATGKKSQKNK